MFFIKEVYRKVLFGDEVCKFIYIEGEFSKDFM